MAKALLSKSVSMNRTSRRTMMPAASRRKNVLAPVRLFADRRPHAWCCAAVFVLVMLAVPLVGAAEYYVAPDGQDTQPGTIDQPFASLAKAQAVALPGDTVWVRGGRYEFVAGRGASPYAVRFDKSGQEGRPIRYWAYPGERPAFDFSRYLPHERIRGFSVQASYLHFKGFELHGVQQVIPTARESWALRVEGKRGGHHNVFERLELHHNEGPGLFIVNGGNNLVLNCDAHHNYDPDRGGENADGFGSHSDDDGNVFEGCRAWNNSDDGFDFINSPGQVTLSNSWAWSNGYVPGTEQPAGNGAGVKAGGFGLDTRRFPAPCDVPRHIIRGNTSFNNRAQGFYANHHPGGIDWINNTAFMNPQGFNLLNDVEPEHWPAKHLLRNNIAFRNKRNLTHAHPHLTDSAANTWDAGFSVSADDFVSLVPEGVAGPRRPDGGLASIDFLRLAQTSPLVDAGQPIDGQTFEGEAPDLGANECH